MVELTSVILRTFLRCEHPRLDYAGNQRIYVFPNGRACSVIQGVILHSFPFYSEIMEGTFNQDTGAFNLLDGVDYEIASGVEEELEILARYMADVAPPHQQEESEKEEEEP